MFYLQHNPITQPRCSARRATRSLAVLCFIALLVAAIFASPSAHADQAQKPPAAAPVAATPNGPGLDVAIADFDGDLHADSASVQSRQSSTGSENYWINFHLSSAGQNSMELLAPSGGLRIEARDVNGDNAVDLVLTTRFLRQPVAILLNDGHGNFSRSEPAEFPAAFGHPSSTFTSNANGAIDAVAVAPQSHLRIGTTNESSQRAQSRSRRAHSTIRGFRAGPFLAASAGRAPPSRTLAS